MIDTIVLSLKEDQFRITDPNKFLPSARWTLSQPLKPIPGIRSKQNPTKKELKAGIYKPRLTLMQSYARRHPELVLRLELSLPKFFFGNNFDELRYKDFAPLCDQLVSALEPMGIITTPEQLALAPICPSIIRKTFSYGTAQRPITIYRRSKRQISLYHWI